ncbi:unnamed protein product [Durusdinium trenchii]|uniref:Beta-lactamase-related domain-containing protein n=2 Tax=Durusdinium trenchii TaxID=1381693 RepID=A0ABP0QSH7_9DINO
MVHKVGVATVLGGACVLAGLFHWSNLALTPRLQVKRCSTKSPREVEGLSLAKLEGLAQDLERRYIQTGKLKGGVLAVVRAGKVVGIWEFGEYNSETVFKFFSISKVFTAIAGLQLCEEKGVSLETPISSLVPEWPADLHDESGSAMAPLLLKHCLTHTGGFSKALPTVHPLSSFRLTELQRLHKQICGAGKNPETLREAVKLEGRHPQIFGPGDHFNYCGVGSQLVARAVEEAFGMSISEYMEKHIFSPASMDSMGFVLDKSLSKQCVSTDYHPWILPAVADGLPGSRWRRLRLRVMGMLGLLCGRKVVDHLKPAGSGVILPLKIWDRSLKFFHPDAGIVGTGADFVEWLKIMTNNGKGNDARQIFSQFVLDALATPTTPELQPPFALDAPTTRGRLFPVRGDRLPRNKAHRPFNSFPGQKFSLGGCVIVEPDKALAT